jgi:tetratricopeptide (TPR) repeat protein
VLYGIIKNTAGRIRVTARLINLRDETSLWAGSFDEKYEDMFRLQDSIVERLAGALTLRLTGKEQQMFTKRYAGDIEAYHAYLRGRHYWNKRTGEDIRKGIEQFQQAIDRDPNFALGYVGLADAYSTLELYGGVPASETIPKARAAADRALQLDDSLAEAHTSSAVVYRQQWRWTEAEEEYKRAISLNPNYATAHQWLGFYYISIRQFDDALREAQRAQELDPVSPIVNDQVALVHLLKNNLDSVVEQCRRNIELHPSFPGTHYLLGSAYLKQQRHHEATAEFQRAAELSGRSSFWVGALGYCYAVTGRRAEALRTLKELEKKYARREALGQHLARVHAGLGNKDQAFVWLEKDFVHGGGGSLPLITSTDGFDNLRSDPRYVSLVRRMGLEP